MTPPAQRRRAAVAAFAVLSVLLVLSPQHPGGDVSSTASGVPQAVAVASGQVAVAERLHTSDVRGHQAPLLPWATPPAEGSAVTGTCGTAGARQRTSCEVAPGAVVPARGPPAVAQHL